MRSVALVYAGLLVVGALGAIATGVYSQAGFAIITGAALLVLMEISRAQEQTGIPVLPAGIFMIGCGLAFLGSIFAIIDAAHFRRTGRRFRGTPTATLTASEFSRRTVSDGGAAGVMWD